MTDDRSSRGPFPIEHAYAAVVGYVLGAYIDLVSDEEIRLDWGERDYSATRKVRGQDAYRSIDANLEDWKYWMTLQIAGFANLADPMVENNKQLRDLARQAVGDDPVQITKFLLTAKERAERILERNEDFRDYLTTRLIFGYPDNRKLDADEFVAKATAFDVHRQRRAKGRSQLKYRAVEALLVDLFGPGIFCIELESTPRRIVISSTRGDDNMIQAALETLSRQGYRVSVSQGTPVHIVAVRISPSDT